MPCVHPLDSSQTHPHYVKSFWISKHFLFAASCKSSFFILSQFPRAWVAVSFISTVNVGLQALRCWLGFRCSPQAQVLREGTKCVSVLSFLGMLPFRLFWNDPVFLTPEAFRRLHQSWGGFRKAVSSRSSLAGPTYSFPGMVAGNYTTSISYI